MVFAQLRAPFFQRRMRVPFELKLPAYDVCSWKKGAEFGKEFGGGRQGEF